MRMKSGPQANAGAWAITGKPTPAAERPTEMATGPERNSGFDERLRTSSRILPDRGWANLQPFRSPAIYREDRPHPLRELHGGVRLSPAGAAAAHVQRVCLLPLVGRSGR